MSLRTHSFRVHLIIATVCITSVLAGCSSIPKTKWTDKSLRVMLDPDSISEENYVQIQSALVQSSKFTVVDRAAGMRAAEKEQERLHRTESDRFADKDKWAHWGKLYGVASIIVGHAQCRKTGSFWNPGASNLECKQFLSMVDTNTGEVFLAVDGENDGPASVDREYLAPDWNDVVQKLVDHYPKTFITEGYAPSVLTYQEVSEEHAQRQKEEVAQRKVQIERLPSSEAGTQAQPSNESGH